MSTPILGITEIDVNSNQKFLIHNQALSQIERLCGAPIIGVAITPPSNPSVGDFYAIGTSSPTGDWSGQGGRLAVWTGTGWDFTDPVIGTLLWDNSQINLVYWSGTDWTTPTFSGGSGDGNDRVRVSANDTTPSFLLNKITAGTNISISETNDGGNETIVISSSGSSGGNALEILDEGVSLNTSTLSIDFVGAGVTSTETSSGNIEVNIPGGSGGGSSTLIVNDEGSQIESATSSLTFLGSGVTASSNGSGDVTVNIPGSTGGGGSATKFTDNVGDGAASTFTLTHSLGTDDVVVAVWESSIPGSEVYPSISRNTGTVTIDFGSTVPTLNQYRVVII